MMLPILISVSVAPVSYFFCASADVEVAANKASVAAATARRVPVTGIAFLPHVMTTVRMCRCFLAFSNGRLFGFSAAKLSFRAEALNEKPPRQSRGGCSFSSRVDRAGATSRPLLVRAGRDDVAEQLPLLVLEAHHLQLLDRRVIG